MVLSSIPSAQIALDEIDKILIDEIVVDGSILKQLLKNTELFGMAKKMLSEKITESVELNIINTLSNLEQWMLSNKDQQGALDMYVTLRVLNTHLEISFSGRYR